MTARRWIAVLTVGSAGLLPAMASWETAPAAAYPASAAGPARRGAAPRTSPSPAAGPATAGGGETVIIASPSASPSPAATAGGGDNVNIASPSPSAAPAETPSPSPAATAAGGETVVIAPEDNGTNGDGQNANDSFRNRFRRGRPFRENPNLEFTGWIGWPELSMGCHFDPYFEGVDWRGRRVICVDRAVRPPHVGLPRVRGRRFFFPRRRFPFHRFP